MLIKNSFPLMDPDPASGGGGGGTAIDESKVTALITAANAKLKGEITTTLTASLKPFESLTTQLTALAESLGGIQTRVEELGTTVKPGEKAKPDEIPPALALQIKNLTAAQKVVEDKLKVEQDLRVKAETAAKNTEKESKLRAALTPFTFANPDAAEDAFTLVSGLVEFDADGKLIAQGLPLDDFVKDFIPSKKAHLLAPAGKGGSGATGGASRGGAGGAFQMEQIKPGMSLEDQAKAAGAISMALQNR